jgi:hypothetical protein
MFKRLAALSIVSLVTGIVAIPGVASATCTSTFAGAGYPRLFDSTTCSGAAYDVQANQGHLALVGGGFNDITGSVQTTANGDTIKGWIKDNYIGTMWVLAPSATQARWVSFASEPTINNDTSSVMRVP